MTSTDDSDTTALPPIGAYLEPAAGIVRHQADFWRSAWTILTRDSAQPDTNRQIAVVHGSKTATARFQEARLNCEDGWVIEALRSVLGGWQLAARAPRLDPRNAIQDSGQIREPIWAQTGETIGMTWPQRPDRWILELSESTDSATGEVTYAAPTDFRDAEHATREQAIQAARRLTPSAEIADRDGWLVEWTTTVGRLQHAGIRSSFTVGYDFFGPTRAICAAPGCEDEATQRVTRTGDDVAPSSRMLCADHATVVHVAHLRPLPPAP